MKDNSLQTYQLSLTSGAIQILKVTPLSSLFLSLWKLLYSSAEQPQACYQTRARFIW